MGNISILSREEIGRDYTEARTLKRKLNNGDWVYVSEENQLLVLVMKWRDKFIRTNRRRGTY